MRAMDSSEECVKQYLSARGFRDIVYEPDGNVPPDFLVDGRIAVEVRRLNQNVETPAGPRGLEEVAIPLQARIEKLLANMGPSASGESWYVSHQIGRPLPPWPELRPAIQSALTSFRARPERQPTCTPIGATFSIDLRRTGRPYSDFFVLGGYVDSDAGGFVLPEMGRNIRLCVEVKTKKIEAVRSKYPEWWLALVDHIGHGLTADGRERLRELVQLDQSWDKVVLVSPLDASKGFDL
jgi:hypothetical protein